MNVIKSAAWTRTVANRKVRDLLHVQELTETIWEVQAPFKTPADQLSGEFPNRSGSQSTKSHHSSKLRAVGGDRYSVRQ